MPFDPDAAAQPGSGIFGLPFTRDESRIILLPVPFDATTSYGNGTADGPAAILEASAQVDLYDIAFGRVYEQGIFMEPIDDALRQLSARARELAEKIIAKGGADASDAKDLAAVNAASEEMIKFVHTRTARTLADGNIPGLVGGDHSTPLGALRAVADHHGQFGILHIDAHMDLRPAFEGFTYSHASIMYNALTTIPNITNLVQVGIRDFGEAEMDFAIEQGRRVSVLYDRSIALALAAGTPLLDVWKDAIKTLPQKVYISFDIDGLDPALCPHTGTPVPGGLSFNQMAALLEVLRDSGRSVIGFDLVEVCPGPDPDEPEWDAAVGARALYKLCGVAQPQALTK